MFGGFSSLFRNPGPPPKLPCRTANVYLSPDGTQWQGGFGTSWDCERWASEQRQYTGETVIYRLRCRPKVA